jgi:hypothetical protein
MATAAKGHIGQLPSGSYRVHVYVGTDPVTKEGCVPHRCKQLKESSWLLAFSCESAMNER